MKSAITWSFEPVSGIADLDRLDVLDGFTPADPPLSRSSKYELIDWAEVDHAIRELLAGLAQRLRKRFPDLRTHPGRTSGQCFALFAYRDFDRPGAISEPIVVGVNIETGSNAGSIRIKGDICGEETGAIHYETPEFEVPAGEVEILEVAHGIAKELTRQLDLMDRLLRTGVL